MAGFSATLAHYSTAVFYYVLGGITFLPLCALVIATHFYLTAPRYHSGPRENPLETARAEAASLHDEQTSEFTEQRKREALDLAVWNQEAEQETTDSKGKETAQGSSTAPSAARRVGPTPAAPRRPHRSGWLVVRRHFQSDVVTQHLQNAAALASAQVAADKAAGQAIKHEQHHGSQEQQHGSARGTPDQAKGPGYVSSLYRGMLNYRNKAGNTGTKTPGSGAVTPPDQQQQQQPEAKKSRRPRPGSRERNAAASVMAETPSIASADGKEAFHCILKGPVLFLYSAADASNPSTECHAAIDLRHKRISIYIAGVGDTMGEPEDILAQQSERHGTDTNSSETEDTAFDRSAFRPARRANVREGELFVKRNAIRIVSLGANNNVEGMRFAQWFIFAKSATLLEDWYHALVQASTLPDGHDAAFVTPDPVGSAFSSVDMVGLLGSLDTVPDPIPLRWLNAMVGRIFFSIYRTAWVESYIKRKIMKKIARVRTPSYLSNIQVQEVDLGRTPPAFSRPMLKSLTGEGEASMEVNVHYRGALRLTISTTLTISLGARFKQYSVSLVLAVIVHSLEGNLLLHIKPPPSNRLWFGFTNLPKMEIEIEPVVSERKVQWSMVKRLLEGRIRELLTESLVVPNMDDIPFFDSRPFDRRGGIWAEMAKSSSAQGSAEEDKLLARTVAGSNVEVDGQKDEVERKTKSTPTSLFNVDVDEGEEDEKDDETGTSSAVAPPNGDGSIRNRHAGAADPAADARSTASSPAAAGLSTLLARDKALTTDGSVDARSAQRRRSWFTGNQGGSGSLGRLSGAASSMTRGKSNQQSSLAWGSASLGPTINDPTPSSAPSSVSATDGAPITSVIASSAEAQDESDATPALSTTVALPTTDGNDAKGSEGAINAGADPALAAKALDVQDSASGASSRRSSAEVATEDKPHCPPLPKRVGTMTSASSCASPMQPPPPPPPRRPGFAHQDSRSSATSFQPSSSAAQCLASIQREPNVTPSTLEERGSRNASASSAALAQTWQKAKASMADRESRQATAKDAKDALKRGWANWNARRSGQGAAAAASDADSMLTSSDRGEESSASGSGRLRGEHDSLPSGRSRTSSWLASSPEDPVSLGVGFDVHESIPAPPDLWLDHSQSSSRGRSPNETASSSRASSISGRKPYREHLAHKQKPSRSDNTSSQASSRRSSMHSSDADAVARLVEANLPSEDFATIAPSMSSKSAWDASVPSVAAPLPLAHREERKHEGNNSATLGDISTSPTSSIRRTLHDSPRSGEAGTARDSGDGMSAMRTSASYSFIPGQPTATVGLSGLTPAPLQRSTSGLSQDSASSRDDGVNTDKATAALAQPLVPQAAEAPHVAASPAHPAPSPERTDSANPDAGATASPPTTSPKGIKQQPTRAAMMAVPGIPSMQKMGPQSFEAPAGRPGSGSRSSSSEQQKNNARLGLGGLLPRLSSSFGQPAQGSPSNTGASAAPSAETTPEAVASALSSGPTQGHDTQPQTSMGDASTPTTATSSSTGEAKSLTDVLVGSEATGSAQEQVFRGNADVSENHTATKGPAGEHGVGDAVALSPQPSLPVVPPPTPARPRAKEAEQPEAAAPASPSGALPASAVLAAAALRDE